jgi:hypothetical protein
MEGELLGTLAELGAQVGFLLYLVTQNKAQATRLEAMQKKYEELLERAIQAIQ